jgi:6-pyruvoyl-tetrahydropterin synthase
MMDSQEWRNAQRQSPTPQLRREYIELKTRASHIVRQVCGTNSIHWREFARFDQADLEHKTNNLPWLSGVNPTTENLVVAIWRRVAEALPSRVRLARVVLWETPRNYVEYAGDDEA